MPVTHFSFRAAVDETEARDGVKELHSRAGPPHATGMGFVASAHYS